MKQLAEYIREHCAVYDNGINCPTLEKITKVGAPATVSQLNDDNESISFPQLTLKRLDGKRYEFNKDKDFDALVKCCEQLADYGIQYTWNGSSQDANYKGTSVFYKDDETLPDRTPRTQKRKEAPTPNKDVHTTC